jgi:hypothetical protein
VTRVRPSMRMRVARRTNGTLAHLHASDRAHQWYKGPFGPVALRRRQRLRRRNTEHPCGGVTHSHCLSAHCDSQSRFLSHCDSQSHLSSRPSCAPLLPARKPNVATGSLALAAASVTAAIRLFAFHLHTVSAFGPPLATGPPDAQRPRQVQTKPSIHVRVSAPTCPRDRGRAPTRGGPYV